MNELIHIRVGQLKAAIHFFQDDLGLAVETPENNRTSGLRTRFNEHTEILFSERTDELQTNEVLLYTNDCIENYCRLKARGVNFKTEPAYFEKGLRAVFSDPFGNDYILLEERIYAD